MKKSRDDLLKSIEGINVDDDTKISLMEDITDSLIGNDEMESLRKEIESRDKEIEIWKEKYKDRFLNNEIIDKIEEKEEIPEPREEEEKEYINIREI